MELTQILNLYLLSPGVAALARSLLNQDGGRYPPGHRVSSANPSDQALHSETGLPFYKGGTNLQFSSARPLAGQPWHLIHETAHADVHHNAQRKERKQDGRTAVTH